MLDKNVFFTPIVHTETICLDHISYVVRIIRMCKYSLDSPNFPNLQIRLRISRVLTPRNTTPGTRYLLALLRCTAHSRCSSGSCSRNARKRSFLYMVCKTPTPAKAVVCKNESNYKNCESTLKPWLIISRAC